MQASSFNSSAVIGPVVSWEPTVVIFASQAVPGRIPSKPQAFSTIFWARENPWPGSAAGLSIIVKKSASSFPRTSLALAVNDLPIIRLRRPPARYSSLIVAGWNSNEAMVSPASSVIVWDFVSRVRISPVFTFATSHTRGSPPESSTVLKKIGAIKFPITTPFLCLFGTKGISSPMCHNKELVADFLEEPVPTTSATKATRCPSLRNLWIVSIPPGNLVSPIERAWKGISGLLQACFAGDKSSVLTSPSTLNTLKDNFSGSFGLERNQSPSAHDVRTSSA